jgi:uncharacterized protein YqjF (DUF2071 family)
MKLLSETPSASALARARFQADRPMFRAGWDRVFMLHYEVDPDALQPQVPFPLDLHEGRGYVSLVAFTLRDLRFFAGGPAFSTHAFLNVRTYVEGNGIYFLAEFLTNPFCVFLGPRLYGLPYRWGRLDYRHGDERIEGSVESGGAAFRYRGTVGNARIDGLDEFLLERYTAFTRRGATERLFHVWHEPWRMAEVEAEILDDTLIATTGPWFGAARPARAGYSPGFPEVWMGRPVRAT